MREKQPETDDNVRLKPIFGIRPGVYLTVLYSIILVLLFFFLLVYPGIKNPSAFLLVKTEPAGAGIRVNDIYMGVSGAKIPLNGGTYTVEAVMPGFETQSSVCRIPGRIFMSLFFPRLYKIDFSLTTGDPAAVFAQAAFDFASWSFGGEPTVSRQIPLSLSEGAYRIGQSNKKEIGELLTAASRFAVTRAALRDLSRAKILLDNGGLSPSASLIGSVSDILVFLSENYGSSEWLSSLLPPESSSVIRDSQWYKNDFFSGPVILPAPGNHNVRRVEFGELTFLEIPAGTIVGSKERLNVKGFFVCENPVPKSLFETFLNENPQWENDYTDYFEDVIIGLPSDIYYDTQIITGITWFAADAFCKWLTNRLPPSMAGMEIRMPMEIEWEYAALFGIKSMEDPVWEWCLDPFAPLQFITAPAAAVIAAGSPERSLRGRHSFSAESSRASLPPEFSSPFVTLRPVIAEKTAQE